MFIDELKIYAKAGDGGNGVVKWKSEKGKPKMGPGGGNGGNGGDVYVRAVRDANILSKYIRKKEFYAEDGGIGMKDSMEGKNGDNLSIDLPIGAVIENLSNNKKFELLEEGQEILILKGGRGGLGNEHFKSSTNTTPEEWTPGKEGEEAEFFVELQLIADIGFIGLPSAGKSSLLNELTKANARVGAYPFTTLEPNLGEFYGYILADIPGLIEGASDGKGLGHKFLRHITRTKALVHCISFESDDVVRDYKIIRKELEKHDKTLLDKKEIIVLTKSDLVDEETVEKTKKEISKLNPDVLITSIIDEGSIKELKVYLSNFLNQNE